MKTVEIEIKGTSPLLMHAMSIQAQEQLMKKGRKVNQTFDPETEAEQGSYRIKTGKNKGELCIPARCIKAAIVNASSWYKIGKRSMKQFIAGGVVVQPYEVSLGTKTYDIDLRPVVIQRGNRIIRARACLPEWKAKFTVVYNEQWITEIDILREILEESGIRIGLLDNRPQKGGENGTFVVTKFLPKSK